MSKTNPPTGVRNAIEEMQCRRGEHKYSEVAEAAYRRGFHQALALLVEITEGEENCAVVLTQICRAFLIAQRMRRDGQPHAQFFHEVKYRLIGSNDDGSEEYGL